MTQPAIASEAVESRRVALVTGGGRRSGAAVVRALADRGYSIAIHAHASLREARAMAEALNASGIESLAVTANMREEGPVRAMVQRVVWLLEHPEANGVCLKSHEALPGSAGRPTA